MALRSLRGGWIGTLRQPFILQFRRKPQISNCSANSSQTVTGTVNYDSFGNTVGTTGSSANPYMFAGTSGYRNDNDAGLMLVGARYYDAQVGRFITRDIALNQQPYLYCDHDPVNAVDPSGHDKVTVTINGPNGQYSVTVEGLPGTTVTVPGPYGPININIPSGSTTGGPPSNPGPPSPPGNPGPGPTPGTPKPTPTPPNGGGKTSPPKDGGQKKRHGGPNLGQILSGILQFLNVLQALKKL